MSITELERVDEYPPELGNETELPEFDDYWLSWPDTLAEQTDPNA